MRSHLMISLLLLGFYVSLFSGNNLMSGEESYRSIQGKNETENAQIYLHSSPENVAITWAGAISGTVYEEDGTTPIPNVEIVAGYTEMDPAGDYEDWTDSNGRFFINVFYNGTYRVHSSIYNPRNYEVEYYNNVPDKASATLVTVNNDTITGLNFTLTRYGRVSGTVYEDDGTTPIPNTSIELNPVSGWRKWESSTNNLGAYTFENIPSGNYHVKATGYVEGQGALYIAEFYNEKINLATADPVNVTSPNTTPGIDFTLTTGGYSINIIEDPWWAWMASAKKIPDKFRYEPGETVTLEVDKFEYGAKLIFTHWSCDASGTDETIDIIMDSNKDICLNFIMGTSLYISENRFGAGEIIKVPDKDVYFPGEVVTIQANPNNGWLFCYWSQDKTGSMNPDTVIMNDDRSIRANFGHTLATSTIPPGMGSVTQTPDNSVYVYNEIVQLTANAPAGYQFTGWSGDASGTQNPLAITMDANKTVTALFAPTPAGPTYYYLSLQASPAAGGNVTPAPGTHPYPEDTQVALNAIPNTGYHFVKWEGDVANPNSAATTVKMSSAKTVTAKFALDSCQITIQVEPIEGGTTIPSSGVHTFAVGDTVDLSAMPSTGYEFVQWQCEVANPDSMNTYTVVDQNDTITAVFQELQVMLNIEADPAEGGTTSPAPGASVYEYGTVAELIAIPEAGFRFAGWTGSVDNPDTTHTTILMESDQTVIAHFTILDTDEPFLIHCYPPSQAISIPINTKIQFYARDVETGINLLTLDVWANTLQIVDNGIDQTGGQVSLASATNGYKVVYTPSEPFEEESTVTINTVFDDYEDNRCDSTYSFDIGKTRVELIVSEIIGEAGGMVADNQSGLQIDIPHEAINDSIEITIDHIENTPPLPDSVQGIGTPYHFGPDGLQFNTDVVIQIPYTEDDLANAGIDDPLELGLYYFHTLSGEWIELGVDSVNYENQLLYVTVNQFCYFTFGYIKMLNPTEVNVNDINAPSHFALSQNYPNPFNPKTRIQFSIPEAASVSLDVYDMNGHKVKTLFSGRKSPGTYEVAWDAKDRNGNQVATGLYLIRFQSKTHMFIRKATFIK